MTKYRWLSALLLLALFVGACNLSSTPQPSSPTPGFVETPTAQPATSTADVSTGVVFSEVMAGIQGNNNYEFIELYNPSNQIVDLNKWSLWYRLATSSEDLPVYRWDGSTLIPPHGHFLLERADQDLGVIPDATFDQGLNLSGGGLQLRQPGDHVAESIGWGDAPAIFVEGSPAEPLVNGSSLERFPGGEAGNAIDQNDNAADFFLNPDPSPQNTGSPITPRVEVNLEVNLKAPDSVEPGSQFTYHLTVANQTNQVVHDLKLHLPLPTQLKVSPIDPDVKIDQGILIWNIDQLSVGESRTLDIPTQVPWAYFTAVVHNYYLQASDWPLIAFGGPVYTRIEGGVIPIATARGLMNAQLSVEGVVTMYTGGYFAGSGNTKFYLEDNTGGLQVQVFSGERSVQVPIGALVRVRGTVDAYRGAMEIVPEVVPDDVQIIAKANPDGPWQPEKVTIQQAANDFETLPGRLVQVTGTVTRLEEFTYSYEIDLADDQGRIITLYIDKLTNINIEHIKLGSQYQATGILEIYDGLLELYPRLPSDLVEVIPPSLMVSASAPNTIAPGDAYTTTLTVSNYTPDTLTDISVSIPLPSANARLDAILDGGRLNGSVITWNLPQLSGDGTSINLHYRLRPTSSSGFILDQGYTATASNWSDQASGPAIYTFIGDTVPIWAIQGSGNRSPYVLDNISTQGVVIGVFPDLGGFWIQDTSPDNDPATSEGLFVETSGFAPSVETGDLVEVNGQIREPSQQTTLAIEDSKDIKTLAQGNTLPMPIEINPPTHQLAANQYYETLEGMLVQISSPALAVSPTSQYGEYVLVPSTFHVNRLWQGDDNGFMIMVDDGSSEVHYDRSTLAYVVSTGDHVSGLVGPLAYTYGRYKIEPTSSPQVEHISKPLPSLEPTNPMEFRLMTWNVENLFDTVEPNPSDPPRPRLADYNLALAKVANTILAAGAPTVVGLQEVENIGILEDLVSLDILKPYDYQPVLIEGTDSRGIDVGYLVRSDRAQILETKQYPAPEGLTSRPPLLIQLQIDTSQGPLTLYVLNNHFTSMSAGEIATEPRRTAQAAWNVTILNQIRATEPDASIAVIGDLNSYYHSLPLDTLREAGMMDVLDSLPEDQRYTYIYQGESQALDHIMLTGPFTQQLKGVDVLHMDADFPPPIPGDTSPEHKSDHDPLVATFSLAP
jgi:predicted extracellular nuclease